MHNIFVKHYFEKYCAPVQNSGQMVTGQRLAWFRTKAGHTQDSLAVASGVSRNRISQIEAGKGGSPRLDTLEALLKEWAIMHLTNLVSDARIVS